MSSGAARAVCVFCGAKSGNDPRWVNAAFDFGRALAARPPLVLADEPTGSLDESSSDVVLELLLQLVGEAGSSLLLVTHSARLAARLEHSLYLHLGQVAAAQT